MVEDEVWQSLAIEALLAEAGCNVLAAFGVSEALKTVQACHVDAALLDINVNGKRVFPLAYALRDRGVPFGFLTADGRDVLPPDLAMVPMLRKPYFSDDQVLKLLEDLLAP
jgi:CheY-like chemotaxis protein